MGQGEQPDEWKKKIDQRLNGFLCGWELGARNGEALGQWLRKHEPCQDEKPIHEDENDGLKIFSSPGCGHMKKIPWERDS